MTQTTQSNITASIDFDFQGQSFKPCLCVDLHTMMLKNQSIEHLYDLLAASIGLDAYRHEYDVMVLQEISFSEPSGLACDFFLDGTLDFDGFITAWQQQQILIAIQPIAQRHLNISDLSQHRDIQKALMESYKTGQGKTRPIV
ncbi:hypothetical protein JYT48_03185 [Mariprofundus ferrooxydans]|nr:hypothetical protein [Mariprofundus ferrooxydans]